MNYNLWLVVAGMLVVNFLGFASLILCKMYLKEDTFAQIEEEIKSSFIRFRKLLEFLIDNSNDDVISDDAKNYLKALVNAEKKYGQGKRGIAEMVRYLSEILQLVSNFRENAEEVLIKSSEKNKCTWLRYTSDAGKLEKIIVKLINRIVYSDEGRILIQKTIVSLAIYRKQLNIRLAEKKDGSEKRITDMISVLDSINNDEILDKEDLLISGKNFLSLNLLEIYSMSELLEVAAIANQGLVLMAFNVTGHMIEIVTRDPIEELYMYSYRDLSLYKSEFTDKNFNSLKKFTKFLKAKAMSKYMKDAALLMEEHLEDSKKK